MIGLLYYAAAGLLAVAAIAGVAMKGFEAGGRFMSLLGLLAAGYGFAGYLLRRLDARARYSATLMAVLGLVALPIGTVLNAYVLWLIHVKRGRTVLSPEYRAVVAETPQFRCRVTNSVLALGIGLVGVTVYGLLQGFLKS
ncbi:MAG: hypothetical protein K0R17_1538 [Rariglobus sp.]|nr:hypothetical protein [Rariglobus sp.]